MNYSKVLWGIRAVLYKCLTNISLPSYIGKPTYINKISKLSFGKKVRIYPGLRAEAYGAHGFIDIGSNVSIGQNFHIIANDEPLIIEDNVVISGNVFITNCDHEYQQIDTFLYDQPLRTKQTRIGEYSFIGYGAVIQAGTILGKQCIVGSNSVVRGRFPDYSVIVGSPAEIIKRYNPESKCWEKIE